MAAPPFVAARVTPEMKTLLQMLSEREQITESALVRQLLEVMLRMSAKEGFPKLDALEKVSRDARLSVRLATEDRGLLCERATARGMPSATYVSVLVRSHLRNLAPLPKEELLALKRSMAQLEAIGPNLNQIARQLLRPFTAPASSRWFRGRAPSGPRPARRKLAHAGRA